MAKLDVIINPFIKKVEVFEWGKSVEFSAEENDFWHEIELNKKRYFFHFFYDLEFGDGLDIAVYPFLESGEADYDNPVDIKVVVEY